MHSWLISLGKRLGQQTLLGGEDILEGEKILYNSLSSWYGEFYSLAFSFVLFILSILIVAYYLLFSSPAYRLILLLFLVGSSLASISLFLIVVFGHYSVRYFVTNKRVLKKSGIFSKHLDAIPYSNIQNVELHKKFIERLVDMGDVYIDLAGGPEIELILDNIPDPEKPYKLIQERMG